MFSDLSGQNKETHLRIFRRLREFLSGSDAEIEEMTRNYIETLDWDKPGSSDP